MNDAGFQFWFFSMLVPVVCVAFGGVALIVWIVMSQRTKRLAITAGLSAEQYARLGARMVALRCGVFLCGLGAALLLIGLLGLADDSPYTWALLLLGCGGALLLNHALLQRSSSKS